MKNKVPIDMLNATALAGHVTANMGLDVSPKMGVLGIKAKMAQAGFPIDFIEIDDGAEEVEIQRIDPPRERHKPLHRSVQIRIEPQEKPGGNEPVFVSVNGVHMLIPRSETCWIDYKYYHALHNAIARIPITDEDSKITGWREVPDVPISVYHVEPPLNDAEKKEKVAKEIARKEAEKAAREEAEALA